MKAVGLYEYLPIENEDSLRNEEVETPTAEGHDLLIEVKAVSVNPVDTKQRMAKKEPEEQLRILGFDASGIVTAVGEACTFFKVGDEVYYAGDVTRNGSNAEYQLVDERLVGKKPSTLTFAEAAAMPLTAITAWESLYDRMKISHQDNGKAILIIGGAGGVGSIAIQLAKQQGLNVIATASRQETKEWCQTLGADHVVNHRQNLHEQLQEIGYKEVEYILCLADTNQHWDGMATCIKPQGTICAIVENKDMLDMQKIRAKSVIFAWEFMFTRAMFQTDDQIEQHKMLTKMSGMFERGELRHTMTKVLSPLNDNTLRQAHKQLEEGKMIGKLVIEQH
ncbi:zinc-binding alcohol dehydrogenase family protein [Shouchella sp. 1P09AA]|uniref:zinc-binding alcohol dehydrogenase family protein n=1 Tax=unclassified Shouchella TaxID=2893065 RepID=UPI0039A0DB94